MITRVYSFQHLLGDDVATRLGKLALEASQFILLSDGSVHSGWLHGNELRIRRELPFDLNGFMVLAGASDGFEVLLSKLGAIDVLNFDCHCVVAKTLLRANARRDSGRWSVGYTDPSFDRSAGQAFLRVVVDDLRWPLRFRNEAMLNVDHTEGGFVRSTLPRGVQCEIRGGPTIVLGHLRDLLQRFPNEGNSFGWSAEPCKDLLPEEVEKLYANLVAAEVPTTSVASKYEFPLTDVGTVVALRHLCLQAKDEFNLKLGTVPVAEGLHAELRDKITNKGHELTLVVEDKQRIFSRAKLLSLGREFGKMMGLPETTS